MFLKNTMDFIDCKDFFFFNTLDSAGTQEYMLEG